MYKCFNISIVTLVLLLPGLSVAEEAEMSQDTAQQIVDDYKALRRQCSESKGEVRKHCFNELSSANTRYKAAKKILTTENGSKNSVHYISFAL